MRERTIPFAGLSFLVARSPANEWLRIQESSTVVRVFNDRILVELLVMGVLKARDAAAVYVRNFVEEAKVGGLVKAAIDNSGRRGGMRFALI